MSPTATRQAIEIMEAYASGKIIQFRNVNKTDWIDATTPTWDWLQHTYRIKPSPTYRPWRAEEVPVGVKYKHQNETDKSTVYIPLTLNNDGVIFGFKNNANRFEAASLTSLEHLLAFYSYSPDNGTTWKPCGVLVEG